MQQRVLEADREAEAGAADAALPRGVGAPEPVEDAVRVVLRHPGAVVAHAEADRGGRAVDGDDDRAPVAVLDRVREQVPQDAGDAARVDLDLDVAARRARAASGVPVSSARPPRESMASRARSTRFVGSPLTSAACASIRLISSRSASSASNRSTWAAEQLRGAGGGRVERVAAVVEHVAREADRRERRAELVRDVRDEALLHPRQVRELRDLPLQAVRHPVERAGERGDDVLAALGDALLEVAVGELLARRAPPP